MFEIAEGKNIVLYKKGFYSQRKVYLYDGEYYAQYGSSFLGLRAGGRTTHPDISWKKVDFEFDTVEFGRMVPSKTTRKRKRA